VLSARSVPPFQWILLSLSSLFIYLTLEPAGFSQMSVNTLILDYPTSHHGRWQPLAATAMTISDHIYKVFISVCSFLNKNKCDAGF